jgi:hypothetical protein
VVTTARPAGSTARGGPARGGTNGGNGGNGGGMRRGIPMLLVVLLFLGIAGALLVNAQNPELVRINLVAQQYGDAWRDGTLASLEFDRLSWPDVTSGDARQIADNVEWITRRLGDPKANSGPAPHPTSVEVDRRLTTVKQSNKSLAEVTLQVTWTLQLSGLSQVGQKWTYPVTLTERQSGGRWRVVWNPAAVHPQIVHGLYLQKIRSLAPRAAVIGAGDTPLPPAGQPTLARSLLGSLVTNATEEQSELATLREDAGDTMGVQGLQSEFDQQLAGGASIQVVANRDHRFAGLPEVTGPLFVGPPETPSPVKVSLDARTQGWVEQALAGAKQPTTLLVIKPSTGELLAVAKSSSSHSQDPGLLTQAPAGPMFGLASTLALLRNGNPPNTLNTRVNCSAPWTYSGRYKGDYQSQVFRNLQDLAPGVPGVSLGAAVEGGCVTGIARLASAVTPQALQTAAYDLGLATPNTSPSLEPPDDRFVANQFGTWGFFGVTPADDNPLHHVENVIGEGGVLVSPLSMTRAVATVATGTRRSVKFVLDPPPRADDVTRSLAPTEIASLQDVMARSVTEGGGSAHALARVGAADLHAMATVAGYGTGDTKTRDAWCAGYRGDYAFTVLATAVPTATGTSSVLGVASKFLELAH